MRIARRAWSWVAVAVVLAFVGGAGLYWFQPWKLVTDREVSETLAAVPSFAAPSVAPSASAAVPSGPVAVPSGPVAVPSGPVVVGQGKFVSHEHKTGGLARLVRRPDGSHLVELVGLSTSNGPDLRVWLSDQPVLPGTKGWHVFDDGEWVELGRLKGNRGDQAYPVPPGTDLGRLSSVTVWCKRFSVSFGAAGLVA